MLIMRGQKEQMHMVKICRDPSDPSLPQGGEKKLSKDKYEIQVICWDMQRSKWPKPSTRWWKKFQSAFNLFCENSYLAVSMSENISQYNCWSEEATWSVPRTHQLNEWKYLCESISVLMPFVIFDCWTACSPFSNSFLRYREWRCLMHGQIHFGSKPEGFSCQGSFLKHIIEQCTWHWQRKSQLVLWNSGLFTSSSFVDCICDRIREKDKVLRRR